MNWQELEQQIRTTIYPHRSRILKADGKGRRLVTSNKGQKIGMRTGAKTTQSKAITYEMIQYAFDTLSAKGSFDSTDFRARFNDEYIAAPCRFSMTGGILVELGLANIVPSSNEEECCYTKKSFDKSELLQILRERFNDSELRTLCFNLGVDYDNLGGDAKADKARELVIYCKNRNRLVELGDAILRERPDAFEFREDLHGHVSNQWSKSDSREEWIHKAFDSSTHLVDIGKTIRIAQAKESRLCKLITDATSDLPEQKRTQIMNIIENDCSNCRTIWADIVSRVLSGIESWEEFISIHCTDQECNIYTKHLERALKELTH